MFELTVCFETGIDEAHNRKMVRYSDLMEMITASSWDGRLVTLEVGSRGFLSLPRFTTLKQQLLQCSKREWERFLVETSCTAIKGTHKIWVSRNWSDTPS